jgi:hypothetical protein
VAGGCSVTALLVIAAAVLGAVHPYAIVVVAVVALVLCCAVQSARATGSLLRRRS